MLLAARLARRVPGLESAERLLAGLVLFAAGAELLLLVLGSLGALRPLPAAIAVSLAAAVEWSVPTAHRDGSPQSAPAQALLGAATGWWLSLAFVPSLRLSWDDLTYHAAVPAQWLRGASLDVPAFTFQAYYPLGAELLGLWFMLPARSDAHAILAGALWLGLAVTAALVLGARLRHDLPLVALGLACFLSAPHVVRVAHVFCAVDLAAAGLGLAALALAGAAPDSREHAWRALLSGLAAGLSLGARVSMGSLVAVVAVLWIGRARRHHCWRPLLLYGLSVATLGGFWYLRNLLLTGNPIFPAALGPFDGPLSADVRLSTTLVPAIAEGWSRPGFWLEFVRRRLDWPIPIGLIAAAGFAAGAWRAFRDAPGPLREQRRVLLLAGVLFVALFPLQPWSGTYNWPDAPLHHFLRYLILPLALGLVLFPSGARGRRGAVSLAVLVAAGLIAAGANVGARAPAAALLGSAVALAARRWPGLAARMAPVTLMLFWVGLAIATPARQRATADRLFGAGRDPTIGAAWSAVDRLPDGSRLALLSAVPSSHTPYYPLFGRRLQHRPVAVYPDGRPRPHLHRSWRDEPRDWWWELAAVDRPVDPATLTSNLRDAKIDYALVMRWPGGRFDQPMRWSPARSSLARALSPERKWFANDHAEIWDLRPHP